MITFFLWKIQKEKKMDVALDRTFKDLESALAREMPEYFVKMSQVKKSFYVLVRWNRSNILGQRKKRLFDVVESISKNIYYNYARNCLDLRYGFFPILSW